MKIIEHLEELSMLKFSDQEKANFKNEFDNIIEFVGEITKVDLDAFEEVLQGQKLDEYREDIVQKSMKREDALLNAPQKKDGCFVAPMVIE